MTEPAMPPGVVDRARELLLRVKALSASADAAMQALELRQELAALYGDIRAETEGATAGKARTIWLEAALRLANLANDASGLVALAQANLESLNFAGLAMALRAAGELADYSAEDAFLALLRSSERAEKVRVEIDKAGRRLSPAHRYFLLLRYFALTREPADLDVLKAASPALRRFEIDAGLRETCEAIWARILSGPPATPGLAEEHALFAIRTAATTEDFARALDDPAATGDSDASHRIEAAQRAAMEDFIRWLHAGGNPAASPAPLEDDESLSRYLAGRGLQPLRAAATWRRMVAEEEAARPLKRTASRAPRRRPLRLALLSLNTNFLLPLYSRLKEDPGVEVRFVDFRPIFDLYRRAASDEELRVAFRQLAPAFKEQLLAHPNARALFEADAVFCDFVDIGAVWASWNLPLRARLFLRLHAYEAYAPHLHRLNWANVDGLVFVAPHIQKFVATQLEERISGIPQIVVPNFRDAAALRQARPACDSDDMRRVTLGMAGAFRARKEHLMALRILRRLRAGDADWRLRFAGGYRERAVRAEEAAYWDEFDAALPDLGSAVQFDGFRHDMPSWYESVGYLLSCSRREGTHETVAEAILAGIVPIVRDWPLNAPFGGAASVYPALSDAGLIFSTVEEAAEIARSVRQDYPRYRKLVAGLSGEMANMEPDYERLVEFIRSA